MHPGFRTTCVARAPGGIVGRARTAHRVAPLLEACYAALGTPLYGSVVDVAHGPAAGIRLVGERRSLAWISGRTESDVQHALVDHLPRAGVFVDVGASIGFLSLLAARIVGSDGTVVAFEPQPEAARSIERNAALNGFRVAVHEMAVSSRSGYLGLEGVGKATAHVVPRGKGLQVTCTSLDAFLAEHAIAPDLIKIDVEGHEGDVLRGMRTVLERGRSTVIIECHGDVSGIMEQFADAGYVVSLLGSPKLTSGARGSGHLIARRGSPAAAVSSATSSGVRRRPASDRYDRPTSGEDSVHPPA